MVREEGVSLKKRISQEMTEVIVGLTIKHALQYYCDSVVEDYHTVKVKRESDSVRHPEVPKPTENGERA